MTGIHKMYDHISYGCDIMSYYYVIMYYKIQYHQCGYTSPAGILHIFQPAILTQ
jgi:hypothetical protein